MRVAVYRLFTTAVHDAGFGLRTAFRRAEGMPIGPGTAMQFANLSIKAKVISAFAFVLVVTLILGIFANQRLGAVNDSAAEVRDNWLPATRALGRLIQATEQFRITQSLEVLATNPEDVAKALQTEKTTIDLRDKNWSAYEPTITPGAERQLVDRYLTAWNNYLALSPKLSELVKSGQREAAIQYFRETMRDAFADVRKTLSDDLDLNADGGTAAANRGAALYDSARFYIWIALGLAALLCVVAGYLIISNVSGPILRMTEAMARLAARDMKTEIAGRERKDEIGRMAGAVQVFKDAMIESDRLAVEQQRLQAEQEAEKERQRQAEEQHRVEREAEKERQRQAEEQRRAEQEAEKERQRQVEQARTMRLADLVKSFDAKATAMLKAVAAAATEMQTTAGSMATTAEETSRQSTAVAAATEQASSNVQTVATAAEELSASVGEIGRQVAQSNRIAGKAVEEAERTNETVKSLSEAAQKIGKVVELINSIASQTNLLALNATIEAARAGEAGKGFAVVASEVKSLANQTARATEDIGQQISGMQQISNEAVRAIQAISATITEINEIATAIAAAIEEQGAATQEIARNVQQAAVGTQEVSANITGVTQAAADTGAAATQVLGAAGELSKQSESLRGEVDRFLGDVRAA
jgi:methyl-accepting chemotaxis protein